MRPSLSQGVQIRPIVSIKAKQKHCVCTPPRVQPNLRVHKNMSNLNIRAMHVCVSVISLVLTCRILMRRWARWIPNMELATFNFLL